MFPCDQMMRWKSIPCWTVWSPTTNLIFTNTAFHVNGEGEKVLSLIHCTSFRWSSISLGLEVGIFLHSSFQMFLLTCQIVALVLLENRNKLFRLSERIMMVNRFYQMHLKGLYKISTTIILRTLTFWLCSRFSSLLLHKLYWFILL